MAYLGEGIKKLGFGLMRLPMIGEDVDIEQTKQMVDLFLSRGFTYFDTAYGYLNGKSEAAAKTALVDRYPRDSFQLATKLPAWAGAKTAEDARGMFYTSLERTGAGYFDFYLLHNLGSDRTEAFDRFGIWDFARSLKEKGLSSIWASPCMIPPRRWRPCSPPIRRWSLSSCRSTMPIGKATPSNPVNALKRPAASASPSSSWSR